MLVVFFQSRDIIDRISYSQLKSCHTTVFSLQPALNGIFQAFQSDLSRKTGSYIRSFHTRRFQSCNQNFQSDLYDKDSLYRFRKCENSPKYRKKARTETLSSNRTSFLSFEGQDWSSQVETPWKSTRSRIWNEFSVSIKVFKMTCFSLLEV